MRPFRRSSTPVVLAVLALAAGCAQPIHGRAVANPADVANYRVQQQRLADQAAARRADAAELTSSEGLGDVPSLDLCSLIPRNDFGRGAKAGPRRPSFGTCAVTLSAPGTRAELHVGPVEDKNSTPFPRRPYDKQAPVKLSVRTDPPSKNSCSLYLQFPDDVRVRVAADTLLPGGKLGKGQGGFLCRASSAAIDQVIDTVTKGGAKHWNLPADSFGTAGTCPSLSDASIDRQLGRGTAKHKLDYPGGQLCQWGIAGATPRAVFQVDVGVPSRKGGKRTKINGRPTFAQQTRIGATRYCYLETTGAAFPKAGKGARELASLYVVLGRKSKRQPCPIARALATAAWRALPD